MKMETQLSNHDHAHQPNRFAVIPTPVRLNADERYTGRGVTVAMLDSGFYPHPDLVEPANRIRVFHDVTGETSLPGTDNVEAWQWHGTQTSVVAAGNGRLSEGTYRSIACDAELALIKVGSNGRISEDNIARGIEWVIENHHRYNIRILNISLGGDEDVPCSKSLIDKAAEKAVALGIVVVAAAGNSGEDGRHSLPPANAPSVITVGGYHDNNELDARKLDLYHSNFGPTADGTVKPEIIAPAMWLAAPILPSTTLYETAELVSQLAATADYELKSLFRKLGTDIPTPETASAIRSFVESQLMQHKIVATHYQHVDGTSFAAPIVSSIVAQMIEANPGLTPGAVKSLLISTADRIEGAPAIRQGFGVVNARRAVELAVSEKHTLHVKGCSPPSVSGGRMVFTLHDDQARSVAVAGDFNGWDTTTSLVKDVDGLWKVELSAPKAGSYQYKFIIDGNRWFEDPTNGLKAPDNHGGLNSLVIVE